MPFKDFEQGWKQTDTPKVSINKYGHANLNKAFVHELTERKVRAVTLRWDEEHLIVGMKPVTPKDVKCFAIHYADERKKDHGAVVNCSSFLRWIRYDATNTRAFAATWNDKEQQFEFRLGPQHIKEKSE
jgi:hypothetical protein